MPGANLPSLSLLHFVCGACSSLPMHVPVLLSLEFLICLACFPSPPGPFPTPPSRCLLLRPLCLRVKVTSNQVPSSNNRPGTEAEDVSVVRARPRTPTTPNCPTAAGSSPGADMSGRPGSRLLLPATCIRSCSPLNTSGFVPAYTPPNRGTVPFRRGGNHKAKQVAEIGRGGS